MQGSSWTRLFLVLSLLLTICWTTSASGTAQTWTNENADTLFSGPDKPTLVTFNTCVKILSVTTNHWNYGQGETPGKISLNHEDGTIYGPWRAFGVNGTKNEPDVYWSFNPGEVVKAGTYLVSDTSPRTWVQNDASDNRGMVTIVTEPVPCLNATGDIPLVTNETEDPAPPVPEEIEGGVLLTPGDIDPGTLKGGTNNTETVPVIEQVGFRLLSGSIQGGDPVYAMLRVKNTGDRALEDGYVSIRLISAGDISTYRAGMGKVPIITAGEERDIPLIIPTSGPGMNETGSTDTLLCTDYLLDGRIHELMEGGYFEVRGELLLSRQKVISVTGCCQEPYTVHTLRGCRGS